jgi:hypothetical protein
MPDLIQKYSQMVRISTGLVPPHPGGFVAPVPSDKEKVDWMYGVLTILDTKASVLLSFDGLLIAAASLLYDKLSDAIPAAPSTGSRPLPWSASAFFPSRTCRRSSRPTGAAGRSSSKPANSGNVDVYCCSGDLNIIEQYSISELLPRARGARRRPA